MSQNKTNRQPQLLGGALLLGLVLPLTACGDGDSDQQAKGSGSASQSSAAQKLDTTILDGLKAQHVQMELTGTLNNENASIAQDEGAPVSEGKHVYRPASSTGKGDYLRKGSNAEGPYSFVIYTDAIHDDEPDNTLTALMTINLPENAQPGSYAIQAYKEAADDEAQGQLSGGGYAWNFVRNVSGTVDVIELGDEITATWDLTAQDAQKREVQTTGSVKNLAFTPQVEMFYEMDIDGEQKEDRIRSGYSKKNNKLTLFGGNPLMYIDVPLDSEAGSYSVGKDDGEVSVSINDIKYDTIDGEIVISENGEDYRTVDFEFQTEGENKADIKGSVQYIPIDLITSD